MKSKKQILAILKSKGQYGKKNRLSVSASYGMDALDAIRDGKPRPKPVGWTVNRGHNLDGHWVPIPLESYDNPEEAVDEYLKLRRKEG